MKVLEQRYTMAWQFALVLALFSFTKLFEALPTRYETLDSRCEPLTIAMCKKLPYNETHFPNVLGHETQREASMEIITFMPLVRINCSPDLLQFLCSLYAPVCMPMSGKLHLLPPCRHHCKKVRKNCIKTLKQYGFNWPKAFKCNKFPKKKSNALCVDWRKQGAKKNRKSKKNKKNLGKKRGNKHKKGRDGLGKSGKVSRGSKGKGKRGKNKKNKGKNKKNKGRKRKNGKKRRMKRKNKGKKSKRKHGKTP